MSVCVCVCFIVVEKFVLFIALDFVKMCGQQCCDVKNAFPALKLKVRSNYERLMEIKQNKTKKASRWDGWRCTRKNSLNKTHKLKKKKTENERYTKRTYIPANKSYAFIYIYITKQNVLLVVSLFFILACVFVWEYTYTDSMTINMQRNYRWNLIEFFFDLTSQKCWCYISQQNKCMKNHVSNSNVPKQRNGILIASVSLLSNLKFDHQVVIWILEQI